MIGRFMAYAPEFKGPMTPEEAVKIQLSIYDNLTKADSGRFISHKGSTTDWGQYWGENWADATGKTGPSWLHWEPHTARHVCWPG